MAITNGYATQAEFKSEYGITESTFDSEIDRAIESASRAIDRYCSRMFYDSGSATAKVFTPKDSIWLRVNDFHTTTGLVVASDHNWDGTFEQSWTLDSYTAAYGFACSPASPDTGEPWTMLEALAGGWPQLRRGVEVTARWGWAATPVEITRACLLLANRLYRRKGVPFGVLQGADLGTDQFIRAGDVDVRAILDPFRRFAEVDRA